MERFPISIRNSAPISITLPGLFSHFEDDPEIATDLINYLETTITETSNTAITEHSKGSVIRPQNDTIVADVGEDRDDILTEVKFGYALDGEKKDARWYTWSEHSNVENRLAKRMHECLLAIIELMNSILPYNSPIEFVDAWDSLWLLKYEADPNFDYAAEENMKSLKMFPHAETGEPTIVDPTNIHLDFCSYLDNYNDKYARPTIATLSVALNSPDEYEGGEYLLSNGFNSNKSGQLNHEFAVLPKFDKNDGLIIDGWTLHGINTVRKGTRYVFLTHLLGTLKG